MLKLSIKTLHSERGATAGKYATTASLIAAVIVGAATTLGGRVRELFKPMPKPKTAGKATPLKQIKAPEDDNLDKQARQDAQEAHEARQEIIEKMICDREVALRRHLDSIIHLASTELDEYGRVKKRGFYRKFAAEKTSKTDAEFPIISPAKMRLYDEFLRGLMQLEESGEKAVEGKSPAYYFNYFNE